MTCMRMGVAVLLLAALAVPPGTLGALAGTPQQQKPQQPPPKKEEPQDQFALSVEVPLVSVDVVVTDNNGNFISGLRKQNFRILENGAPQQVSNFTPTDAPLTIVVLMEFSRIGYGIFSYYSTNMAYDFLSQLKPEDWVALVSYDLKTRIEVDFTRNKDEVRSHVARMYFPGFSEACLFDALWETLDNLKDVKGKKSILILGTGLDTFSKHTLDDMLKRLKQTDVTIFSVGVGRDYVEYLEARGVLRGAGMLNFLQGENVLRSFAAMTGGRHWSPRFEGEWHGIFSDVAASLRNQYSLGYTPLDQNRDGKFRKIKVELVGNDGSPLIIKNEKGKQVKFVVYAREGYLPPKGP